MTPSPPPSPSSSDDDVSPSTKLSLRSFIGSARELLSRSLTAAQTHSPLAPDKVDAMDRAVSSVIHTAYQSVKRVAVHGHPAVIMSVAGIATAVPSLPFGARAVARNTGLGLALTAVMIYPDHLSSLLRNTRRDHPSSVTTTAASTSRN